MFLKLKNVHQQPDSNYKIILYTWSYSTQALSWGKEIMAMSGSGPGYSKTVMITPYMHSLIFHVPMSAKKM